MNEETSATCEFCEKTFKRERTMLAHACPGKTRWLDRDTKQSKIGFQTWLQFYARSGTTNKKRTFRDYIKSPYYSAFAKFGAYCISVKVVNVDRYADWLLKSQTRIDTWCNDSVYDKFLIEYLRTEDPLDAIVRSIEHMMTMAASENINTSDVLRFMSQNIICRAIVTGKISPWLLFQSQSGVEFLGSLNQDQVHMIESYINPELWAIKFNRDQQIVGQVKGLLEQAGL